MIAFRSRVRLVAVVWLLCQVASLSAFVPEDCCARHTAMASARHAEAKAPCHESEAAPAPEPEPGADCPMHHGEGAACPMHKSTTGKCCGMSNGCKGPNQPLAHLFSLIGVLATPVVSMTAPPSAATPPVRSVPLRYRLTTPDAPPPKA
jgi:hypothetical protein